MGSSAPTVRRYWEEFGSLAVAGVKARTAMVYASAMEARVLPLVGDIPIDELRRSDVLRLLVALEGEGLSFSYVSDHLGPLSKLCDLAVGDSLIGVNPVRRLGRRRPHDAPMARALTPGELAAFLARVPEGPYRRICSSLAFTGCRFGEVSALVPSDFDLARGFVRVSRSVSPDEAGRMVEGPTKTGRARVIPVLPQWVPVVERAMCGVGPQEHMFLGPRGGFVTSSNLARAIRFHEWRDDIKRYGPGQPKLRFHDLRHTAISLMLAAGIPVNQVMAIAGHAEMSTTQRYAGVDEAGAIAAGRRFGAYLAEAGL